MRYLAGRCVGPAITQFEAARDPTRRTMSAIYEALAIVLSGSDARPDIWAARMQKI